MLIGIVMLSLCNTGELRTQQPPNSALKLTVRPRFSRRPSRLPRLEFARRRATCTGIIGCAASGAPLDAGRPPAARNLTSRRWADEKRRPPTAAAITLRPEAYRIDFCLFRVGPLLVSVSMGVG